MNKMITALTIVMGAHMLNAAALAVAVPTAPIMPVFDPNAVAAQQQAAAAAQAAAPAQAAIQPQQVEAPAVLEKSDRVIGLTEDGKKVYALKKNGKGHNGKHHEGKIKKNHGKKGQKTDA